MRDNPPALVVSEVFYSIQGESSLAGYPCVFIRLSGCNLRCSYCDAGYSYEEPGTETAVADLLRQAEQHPRALVEITGGEPLLQQGVYLLMDKLLAARRTVLLETNGSVLLDKVPAEVIKIVDLKCPDSGMHERMDFKNLELLVPHDELKFVLSSRQDYEWAVAMITKHRLAERAGLLFSPIASKLAPADLAQWLLADELPVRLQLQLHAILWPGQKRGV